MCHYRTVTSMSVTIQDVAKVAGVSTATVSRVLNGASTVDAALARRVREAIAATNYIPNSHGRALRRQVSQTWAAIVPDVQNPFFTTMVAALESAAVASGYAVILCNSDEQVSRERTYVQAAIAQRMAGVVIGVVSGNDSDLQPFFDARIPTVLFDRRIEGYNGDIVETDNVLAGRMVAEHLLQAGRRRIACIAGPADVSTTEDRVRGFEEVLAASGNSGSGLLYRANLRPEGGESAVRTLLAAHPDIDAIFATNGPLTVGAYRAIQNLGIDMPRDVALVGVDDDMWTRMVSPRVTVVQQPVAKMGAVAAELLFSHAEGKTPAPQHLVLRPQLLVRGSSARLD